MALKGTKVRHKSLGVGVIEDDSSKLIISVRFHNAPGGEKCSSFMVPGAFKGGFLFPYGDDLGFVHEYEIDTQPEVYINSIERY